MKKFILALAVVSTAIFLGSCYDKYCRACGTVKPGGTVETSDNVILLDSATANTYICYYKTKFASGNNPEHTRSIFLDSSYFIFLNQFFTDSPKYDGLRIYFADYDGLIDPVYTHQMCDTQISLIFAPAIDSQGQLDKFWAYGKDKKFNFGYPFFDPGFTTGEVTVLPDQTKNQILYLDPALAKNYMGHYKDRFEKSGNNEHTKSIFMPSSDFTFLLGNFFIENRKSSLFSGIRIYFAAYDAIIPKVHNVTKMEITLIMTAAKSDPGKSPDFNALNDYYNENIKNFLNANHGELCPNSCDTVAP